jgi:uncharacterized damage-inducible protein DinB
VEINSIQPFLEYYSKVRERTLKLIRIIPHDRLEWSYMEGKFTIGDQVRHIAAIERYMFAETLAGRKSTYHGCGRNLADGYENLLSYFNELHRQSLEIFAGFTDDYLQRKCLTPGDAEITVWKWMRLMVEHEIHHRAELYIYLNLLGIKTPPMYGLSAEDVERLSLPPRR